MGRRFLTCSFISINTWDVQGTHGWFPTTVKPGSKEKSGKGREMRGRCWLIGPRAGLPRAKQSKVSGEREEPFLICGVLACYSVNAQRPPAGPQRKLCVCSTAFNFLYPLLQKYSPDTVSCLLTSHSSIKNLLPQFFPVSVVILTLLHLRVAQGGVGGRGGRRPGASLQSVIKVRPPCPASRLPSCSSPSHGEDAFPR